MKMRILMVCLGNICRSPLAEGILKAKLPRDSFTVDSAGTGAWHVGSAPDVRSVAVAKDMGIDLSTQRARQFQKADFDTFDRIYVMDKANLTDVLELAPDAQGASKVSLLLNASFPGEDYEVPDPYYGGNGGFIRVFDMIDQACEAIATDLLASPNQQV